MDPRNEYTYTDGYCTGLGTECKVIDVNGPQWRYNDCRCDNFPIGSCASVGEYDDGTKTYKDCGD